MASLAFMEGLFYCLSFSGYLRFSVMCNSEVDGSLATIPGLNSLPLVQLQSQDHQIVLEHYPQKLSASGRYAIRLDQGIIKYAQFFCIFCSIFLYYFSLEVAQ